MVILASYGLGCFASAFYLVRWRTGRDIRSIGSGTAGATNAGRILGVPGFTVAFLVDFVKGALAVGLARYLELGSWAMILAMVAVVAGHVWPVQLQFRGGKGIATSLGAILLFDGWTALLLALGFILWFLLTRNFTFSGLLSFAICPCIFIGTRQPDFRVLGSSLLAFMVLIAHRNNLRQEWRRWRSGTIRMPTDKPASKEVK
ncbi:MAG: glycerol-3-phosphate acyltransferase [Candidatus Omnitrophica bacterium]|nr:glycerol-3-phosphate acyltransferase [Candidatus Omnitrophota bacterium]